MTMTTGYEKEQCCLEQCFEEIAVALTEEQRRDESFDSFLKFIKKYDIIKLSN